VNPFSDDEDEGLGIDIFAAIRDAVKSPDVQAQFAKIKSPIPAIQGISGGPKLPQLPAWMQQLGKATGTLVKTTINKAKSQPTTPATSAATGEPLVPSAGGVGRDYAASLISPAKVALGLGLVGAAVYMLRRRK